MKSSRRVVMGVDVSERAMGLVALPWDWDLNWSRVVRHTCGVELHNNATSEQHVGRIQTLVQQGFIFAQRNKVTDVWFEGYQFTPSFGNAQRQALNARSLRLEAEVAGALKVVLYNKLGLVSEDAPLSSARKMVLGKLPRSGAKTLIHATVHSFSSVIDGWTGDEIDAWVAANYGIGQIGGCVTCHPDFAD